MKFIHTSDWHLGRQFHNVSLLQDQRHVLQQIVAIAEREQVDAVVVAGDIYDRSVPPAAAVDLLDEVLHQLCHQLKIPVIMIPGNHDSAQRLRFAAKQLRQSGLYILADLDAVAEPVILQTDVAGEVAFFGLPYCDPEHLRSAFGEEAQQIRDHQQALTYLIEKVKQANHPSQHPVLIAHCFVVGGEASESERPLSIGGSEQVSASLFESFSYTALGHLHGPQRQGADHVRYSGSPLKYSFSEQHHNKSITLVSIDKAGDASTELVALEPLRNMRCIEGELADILAAGATDPHRDDYLMVRLTDHHAILDPMGKLRSVYPNVLHLERSMLRAGAGAEVVIDRDRLKQSEIAMFRDFFTQTQQVELTEEQEAALQQIILDLHRTEEGA